MSCFIGSARWTYLGLTGLAARVLARDASKGSGVVGAAGASGAGLACGCTSGDLGSGTAGDGGAAVGDCAAMRDATEGGGGGEGVLTRTRG